MSCLITRQMENLKDTASEEIKSAYMREVFQIIGAAGPEDTAPVLIAKINVLHEKYFGHAYSFEQLKKEYNQMMLEAEERIRSRIIQGKEPQARTYRETIWWHQCGPVITTQKQKYITTDNTS